MRKEILFVMVFCLLAFSLITIVSAGDVELEVITYANHDVTANIVNPGLGETIHSLTKNSGSNGKTIFNFSASISRVDISIVVRKNGKIVVYEKFDNYAPVGQISLRVLKEEDNTTPENTTDNNQTINDTAINDTNQTQQPADPTTNASTTIPANTTDGENNEASTPPESSLSIARIIFYALLTIFLVVILVGIILFFVFRKRMASPGIIKVKKYSEMKKESESKDPIPKTEEEKRLLELEAKIKGLQGEIYDIKNRKSKIREAEEKLKEDMEELEKLKKAEG